MIHHESIPDVVLRSTIPSQARQWRNEYAIRRWCRQYTLISQAQHQAWLQRIETDPSIRMFGIWADSAQPTGFVGVCGLTSIDRQNQSAEFSLYIATTHQRQGYARKALSLLLMHAFWDYNLNRIWGETFDGNPAATLFVSLGMQHEGTLRQSYYREGRFIDSHLYGITREDFNARHRNRSGHSDQRHGGGGQPGPGGAEHPHPESGAAAAGGRLLVTSTPSGRDWLREEWDRRNGEVWSPTGPVRL